ncbi:hypothetical protein IFR04_013780 [Cadophora malorum]|uniref:Uncharacterized protein n=1 Tax=Cadophora malorum TaxID=108018 RepID=A0A8H7W065_9HELO|nr:hypothetical protein IFR04_013780 [Cadophora malorum]
MERFIVPVLKHGGLVREISTQEEKRTYEKDRARVKKAKKMLELGQSRLLVPSQHHNKGQHQGHSIGRSGGSTLSGLSDSFVLTGSEFLDEMPKPFLTGYESWCAEKEIKEALQTDMFKMWPVEEEEMTAKCKEKSGIKDESKDSSSKENGPDGNLGSTVLQGRYERMQIQKMKGKEKENEKGSHNSQIGYRTTQNEKRHGKHNETLNLPTAYKGMGLRTREEIEREWKAKEERDIAGRARVPDGYEDVMEMEAPRSLDAFRPSLLGVVPEDYQRGQSTDEESEGENWGMLHRKQPEQVTRRGYGKKQGEAEEDAAVLAGITKNDVRTKINNTRNANDTQKNATTNPGLKTEQKENSGNVPKRVSAPSYRLSFQGARYRQT